MRVLMITQKLDPADPRLGFTVGWARALAARVNALDVLCLEGPRTGNTADLPPNIRIWSMGKERGYGRARMVLEFYRALRRSHPDLIFSHMIPRHTWLAAPYAALRRIPQVLWYTHWSVTGELKLALAIASRVATAVPESFPLQSSKVHALGHGIDAEFFTPDPAAKPDEPPLIVQVARLARPKHQLSLLRAAASPELRERLFQIALVGEAKTPDEQAYERELRDFVRDSALAARVTFTDGLDPAGVRAMYRRAALAINLSPPGMFDKAAIEAMMTGTPTITASRAFDALYGEHADALRVAGPEDIAGIIKRLSYWLAADQTTRAQIAAEVRARAIAAHSLNGLMDRLVALMQSL